jgi:hypothetical protein
MNTLASSVMAAAAAGVFREPRRGALGVLAVCAAAVGLAGAPLAVAPIAAADSCDVGFQDTGKGHDGITVCAPIPGVTNTHYGADSPKQDAELSFLQQLPAFGVSGLDTNAQGKAIQLGYLLCQLDSTGRSNAVIQTMDAPALATAVLNDARAAGMCKVMNIEQPGLAVDGRTGGVDPSVLSDINQKISDSTLENAGIPIEATEGRNPATGGSVNPYLPCAQTDSC